MSNDSNMHFILADGQSSTKESAFGLCCCAKGGLCARSCPPKALSCSLYVRLESTFLSILYLSSNVALQQQCYNSFSGSQSSTTGTSILHSQRGLISGFGQHSASSFLNLQHSLQQYHASSCGYWNMLFGSHNLGWKFVRS